jgi:hypothetical protein
MLDLLAKIGGFLSVCTFVAERFVRWYVQRGIQQKFAKWMKQAAQATTKAKKSWGAVHNSVFKCKGTFDRAHALHHFDLGNSEGDSVVSKSQDHRDPKMLEKELRQLAYVDLMDEWVQHDRSGTKVKQLRRALTKTTLTTEIEELDRRERRNTRIERY